MKNVIKCTAFAIILISVIGLTLKVLNLKDTSGGNDNNYSAYDELYKSPRNSIDVVFVGSSHCYNSIYPAVIWHEHGIASFDMAVSRQSRNESLGALREVLKTQKPRVVAIEMYGLMDADEEEEGNLYRNFVTMRRSGNMLKTLKGENQSPDAVKDNFLKWPIVHTRYRELGSYDFYGSPAASVGRGEDMRMGETGGDINYGNINSTESEPVSEANKAWIDELYALSKSEGFELMFFLSPYFVFDNERLIINGAKEYAGELGIPFLDYNTTEVLEEISLDPATDMMNDFHHINMYGATKASLYMGDYLSAHYDIPDNRGSARYAAWDGDYKRFVHMLEAQKLSEKAFDSEYIEYVLSLSGGYTVLLSLDGDFTDETEYMELFGIPESECFDGGKWIVKDGTVKKIMSNIPGESHIVPLSRFDELKVRYGDDVFNNIYFNLHPMVMTGDGLNILVYDNYLEKLVSVRGIY